MNKTFDIGLEDATLEVADLSKEILVLRLAFGKLKAAMERAFAPISVVLVTALQNAVYWATRLVNKIGKVIAALFGVKAVQTAVTKSIRDTEKAVKRTVAGFDQINRLNGDGSGTQSTSLVSVGELTPELAAVVQKIMELLAPLQNIDFFPLRYNLARLHEAFAAMGQQVGGILQILWHQVLTPFVSWVAQTLAPALAKTLTAAVQAVTVVLAPLKDAFTALLPALQPVFSFIGQVAVGALETFRGLFQRLVELFTKHSGLIPGVMNAIASAVSAMWQLIRPVLDYLREQWSASFDAMGKAALEVVSSLFSALQGVMEFLTGVFTGNWSKAWNGLCDVLKHGVNSVIGFLNMLLTGISSALNGIIRMINKLQFTLPDWVPVVGGETFGFQFKTVTAPQIPYLAKGAVLPANRPFLAMVGDQRNGTNIEAPLATIQEAVALVLDEQLSALMAGFDATVSEIRQLHNTVSNIEVGDSVIGCAARRYEQKMAVVNGRHE